MSDKKNVVFIPNINLGDDRSAPYKYSIKSWKKWCESNDCELVIFDKPICDVKDMKITWQRYYVLEILDNSNIEYNQVLMVDADTIVHPNTPNFFNMTDNKFCSVHNEGSYDWICRSIEVYHKYLFDDIKVPFDLFEYINAGFLIFNKSHKKFLSNFIEFYFDNKEMIISLQDNFHVGTCQPIINFFARIKKIDMKLLPYEFNMCDLPRKEILNDELLMTKVGWIYHFNSISQDFQKRFGDLNYWMKKTYEKLYK